MGPGYESDEERWRRAYDRERSRDSRDQIIAWFWNGALGQPLWMKVLYAVLSLGAIAALIALFALDAILNG
ncbi:MAG: hypothetical protein F4X03_03760 [Dehalococcoidia bacterium]|nr:hypothetical protein [Dehalococcoidia bacterium]MYD28019.1 hypothetical protein [Dehalococcoidia bacterium]